MSTVEPAPTDSIRPRMLGQWVVLLAGPIIWSGHFFLVYLLTEAVCGLAEAPSRSALDATTATVLGATVVGFGLSAAGAVAGGRLWRRATNDREVDRFMGVAGVLLGSVFAVAILFVGLPALVLEPC